MYFGQRIIKISLLSGITAITSCCELPPIDTINSTPAFVPVQPVQYVQPIQPVQPVVWITSTPRDQSLRSKWEYFYKRLDNYSWGSGWRE